jgi:Tetratricopeptide repeat
VAKVLGNAASGTTCATGSVRRRDAKLQGLLDARQRLLDVGDTDAASNLTEVICTRLREQGDIAQAAALAQATLEAMPSPSVTAARWLHELGTIAQLCGDDRQAHGRHLLAVQMFAEVGDAAGVARSYDSLGTLAHARGDYQEAEHYYQAATCFDVPQPSWPTPAGPPAAQPGPGLDHVTSLPGRPAEPAAQPGFRGQPEAPPQPELPGPRVPEPIGLPSAELTLTDIAPVSEAACAEAARAGATRVRPAPARPGTGRAAAASGRRRGRWGRGRWGRRRGRASRAGGMRPAVLAAGTVVVAAAVAIAVTVGYGSDGIAANGAYVAGSGLIGGGPARAAPRAGAGAAAAGPAAAGAVAAGGDRVQAAAWVAGQISSSAVVGCDQAMCTALRAQGVAAGNLVVIGADGQSDPLGSDIVVATAAIRGTLGTRLAQVYAPLVLAQFGNGSARIEVRVTAPDGSAAYLAALRADRGARVTAGRQLLANRRLSEAAGPGRELADGQVDARLLTSIAALTAVRRLRIVAFGASGPGADPRVPLPSAEIAAAGPGPAGAVLSAVAAFLRAQRSPYLASVISLTRLPSGQPVLRVTFGEPSPLGLLGLAG